MNAPSHRVATWFAMGLLAALLLLGMNLLLSVRQKAGIAISVAEQHGQELLMIREDITLLRGTLHNAALDTYRAQDAQRDLKYIEARLNALTTEMESHDH